MEVDELVKEAMVSITRQNNWEPVNIYKEDESGADGAEDTLQSEMMPPRYIYVITNITAYDATTVISSYISVGYVSGGVYRTLHISTPAVGLTTSWQGQVILKEGDRVKARFVNTTSGDDIHLIANGYRIPLK